MTPTKFLLILAVVVGVVFGVGFAVRHKTGDQIVDLEKSWTTTINRWLAARQRFDVARDLEPMGNLREGNLVLPAGVTQVSVNVTANEDRSVRKAQLAVSGQDTFSIHYQPSGTDAEGVPIHVKEFKSAKPVDLVFLKGGGTLTFTRAVTNRAATITIR